MSDNLRSRVIKLAYSQPNLRPILLPLLTDKVAMVFTTQEALDKYLKDHPSAKKTNHRVQETKGDKGKGEDKENPEHKKMYEEIDNVIKGIPKDVGGDDKLKDLFLTDPMEMADGVKKHILRKMEKDWDDGVTEVGEYEAASKQLRSQSNKIRSLAEKNPKGPNHENLMDWADKFREAANGYDVAITKFLKNHEDD
jgi:ribosomal protein S25